MVKDLWLQTLLDKVIKLCPIFKDHSPFLKMGSSGMGQDSTASKFYHPVEFVSYMLFLTNHFILYIILVF